MKSTLESRNIPGLTYLSLQPHMITLISLCVKVCKQWFS